MRSLTVRVVAAFGLIGCLCHCLGQSGLPDTGPQKSLADASVYQAFFSEVARLDKLNGETIADPTTAKDAIGLTGQEARILNELAADYESKSSLIADAERRLTWEIRIRTMGSENIPAVLSQQLKDLEYQRRLMALGHLQRLQTALGDSRFKTLDAYVRSKEKAGRFFPPDPTGKPVVVKVAPQK